ncbi:MAG: histone deacetylase [Armatimonadota bacterium]|nr:histone deacetylase [Armatimonadota bacterium]MDR7414544.1 histone deacetylase [Armatimonadota bacterium]MDR7429194.1 histone deacetylase [Armatimonadota bacterium]MDR7431912.1 histone deacetylase [Armatimonadota bacterium]MDR7445510.1 histone deacetylase [Armatimonadota bacterium]
MSGLVLHHPDCLLHVPPRPHPEKPERLQAVREALERAELWDRLPREEPEPAGLELLEAVHPRGYLDQVRRASRAPGVWLDPDTYAVEGTWRAVAAASGAAVRAVDAVVRGEASWAFALVRPPGHHAGFGRAMGFCLVNHVAVATRYAQERLGVRKVLVVDWDVHHGNGTQEVFYRDGGVLFASVHQEGWYPGTGAVEETGEGDGEGLTVNIPLPAGVGDEGYRTVFEEVLIPLGDAWRPELVVVSAGFDAHHTDPLGRMQVTEAGFGRLSSLLQEAAGRWCGGKVVLVLEGGYDPRGLAGCVEATLRVLAGLGGPAPAGHPEVPYAVVRERVRQVRRVLSTYWSL